MLENEKKRNDFNSEESRGEDRNNQIQDIEQQEDIFAEDDVVIPEEMTAAEKESAEEGAVSAGGTSEAGVQPEADAAQGMGGSADASGAHAGQQEAAGASGQAVGQQGAPNSQYRYSYRRAEPSQNGQGTEPGSMPQKHKKHMSNYAKAIACAVLCGVIVGGCIIGSYAIGKNAIPAVSVSTNAEKLSTASGSDEGSDDTASGGTAYSVSQIAKQCSSSVVAITTKGISEVQTLFGTYQQESQGSGSGVIVSKTDTELLIVTNYHVVEGAEELTVCFNDSQEAIYSAQVKGTDPDNDLAVVSILLSDISAEDLESISIATIGDSESLQVGDGVVAIGNALGLGQSVTSGVVSALDREVTVEGTTATLLQTDAAINPGNSGGALFNRKGELIGINSAKYGGEQVEGMGFAIPMATAQPIIEDLMSQETRTKLTENYGCLNITGQDVSAEAVQMYGVPEGVLVYSVLEDGAAGKAGIQEGDILTAVNDTALTGIDELKSELQYYSAGETVEITLQRNSGNGYEEQKVSVTLDNASEQDTSALQGSAGQNGQGSQEEFSFGNGGGNGFNFW